MKGEWSSIDNVLTDTFPAPVPPAVPVQFDEDDFDEDDDITPWNVMVKIGKPKKMNSNQRRAAAWKAKGNKIQTVDVNVIEEDISEVANVNMNSGWEKLELTVDSGAAETICPAKEVMSVATTPGAKFIQGVRYTCANGKKLPNLGEKKMVMCTDESNVQHKITMQVADVNRALMSVSKAVDAGNKVVFDDGWSYIEDKSYRTTIQRRGGLYVLESWVKARDESDGQPFGRQGGAP